MAAKMTRSVSHSLIACLVVAFASPAPAHALEQKKADAAKVDVRSDAKMDPRAPSDAQQFCVNNAALLGDARLAYQTARLTEIETQIRQRLAELESKKTEYESWLRKREDVMKQAAASVVAIYAKMRPDAAALQLAAMDDPVAAAILAKLPSRAAGAILNEMEAGRAARLTRAMTGSDAASDEKKS